VSAGPSGLSSSASITPQLFARASRMRRRQLRPTRMAVRAPVRGCDATSRVHAMSSARQRRVSCSGGMKSDELRDFSEYGAEFCKSSTQGWCLGPYGSKCAYLAESVRRPVCSLFAHPSDMCKCRWQDWWCPAAWLFCICCHASADHLSRIAHSRCSVALGFVRKCVDIGQPVTCRLACNIVNLRVCDPCDV
jgi:hypothetical protein